MADPVANSVLKYFERLKGDRGTWESHWQELANYLYPERATFTYSRSPGQKAMTYIYDSTPPWALDQNANGLHGFLTSTDVQWFGLATEDDAVNADYDCSVWLDMASRALYRVFSSEKYNFATQSHEYYQDLACIGTALMTELEAPDGSIRFSTKHMRECVVDEGEDDKIDTVVRRFRRTAKQAIETWGPAAGEEVVKAMADDRPDAKFWFLHQVKPRRVRDPQRADAKHKKWESIYVSETSNAVVQEGGFDEFPYLGSRFAKASGEMYGRSPGMRALPDVKMLYEMMKTTLKGAQKIVDPPLMVPEDAFMLPLRTTPGAKMFFRAGTRPSDRIEPLKTGGDIALGRELINDMRQGVIRTFYVDWFILPSDMADPASDGKGVTATYTQQQREQKMRQASAMVARMRCEFLGPLIERTFNILWARSKAMRFGQGSPFPPPPALLAHRPLRVNYVSPLAIAQQSSELDKISRLVQAALGLSQVDPRAGAVINSESILRRTQRDLNAPPDALFSPAEMTAKGKAEAAAAQQQQEQQAALAAAKAGKDGSSALQNLSSISAQAGAQGAAGAGFAPTNQALAA